jgi:hypothetical protein
MREKPADRQWLNPDTFLNQQRWEDKPAPEVKNGKTQRRQAFDDALTKLDEFVKSGESENDLRESGGAPDALMPPERHDR